MNTVLFDLDGTLLPLDQDEFIKEYFSVLTQKFSGYFPPKDLVNAIWSATKAMIENEGIESNSGVFWRTFSKVMGSDMKIHEPEFESFYLNEFSTVVKTTHPNKLSDECVKELKRRGYTVALATNPIFPAVATFERIRWAGLDAGDFFYISTYENSNYCKPNTKYYEEILKKIGKRPLDCMMVGNDTREDGAAAGLGIPFYLLEGHVIEHDGYRAEYFEHGDLNALLEYIRCLPKVQ